MVCCKALTFIGGRVSQLLLDQLIKMRIQTCGCSSNLCPQLDRCQVEIQPGCFRRDVSSEQGDIFQRDAGSFERRQSLVAEGMRVQLWKLERDSQRFNHVVEGARHKRTAWITRRLGNEQRPRFVEGERVDQSPALVIQVVIQYALANG